MYEVRQVLRQALLDGMSRFLSVRAVRPYLCNVCQHDGPLLQAIQLIQLALNRHIAAAAHSTHHKPPAMASARKAGKGFLVPCCSKPCPITAQSAAC